MPVGEASVRRLADAGLLMSGFTPALLAAQAILRAIGLDYFPRDPRYLWHHLQNDAYGTTVAKIDLIQSGFVEHPTNDYTNAWLARERPRPVDVVVLGDSIAEPAIYLDARRRELCLGVELLNGGVTVYDTLFDYRMVEHLGCGWQQTAGAIRRSTADRRPPTPIQTGVSPTSRRP